MTGCLQGVCLPGSQRDLQATLCIRCREQLPALVPAAAPLSLCPAALEAQDVGCWM